MKIRIKENSIRIRLTRSEVTKIAVDGYIQEHTVFNNGQFIYALKVADQEALSASLENNRITMFVPVVWVKDWPVNNVIGFRGNIPVTEKDSLFLLLEKDFVCLDETTEDQSDNYDNPAKTC